MGLITILWIRRLFRLVAVKCQWSQHCVIAVHDSYSMVTLHRRFVGPLNANSLSCGSHYSSGQNDYLPVFFLEPELSNLVKITGTGFFPWGPIFEFGNNYRPVFSPGEPFSNQVKMPEAGLIPWGAVFESGKKYREIGCGEFVTEYGCSRSTSWCCVCVCQ